MSIDLLLRGITRHRVRIGRSRRRPTSLDAMAAGGIYDHLGGGFARYSIDERWLVPHFEKMLYDKPCSPGSTSTPGRSPARPATARCSTRRSTTCCATCATPTAASTRPRTPTPKGVEGKFYVWTLAEVREVLGARPTRRRLVRGHRRAATSRAPTQHPVPLRTGAT